MKTIETKSLNASRLFRFLASCRQQGRRGLCHTDPMIALFNAGDSMASYIRGEEWSGDWRYDHALQAARQLIRYGCHNENRNTSLASNA